MNPTGEKSNLSKSQKKKAKKKECEAKPNKPTTLNCQSPVVENDSFSCFSLNLIPIQPSPVKSTVKKMVDVPEKSREEVMAERAAKKQEKLLAKQKNVTKTPSDTNSSQTKVVKETPSKKQLEQITKGTENIKINASEKSDTKPQKNTKKQEKPNNNQQEKINNNQQGKSESQNKKELNKVENKDNIKQDGKSKAQLKAERRALQEAQRAAKVDKKSSAATVKVHVDVKSKQPDKESSDKPSVKPKPVLKKTVHQHRVKLFAHLYTSTPSSTNILPECHPAITRLGAQYRDRIVCGSNARCYALLSALKEVVLEFETPTNKVFTRSLETLITQNFKFLSQCRPASVSMSNAVRQLKSFIYQVPESTTDKEAKDKIIEWIETFSKEQLEKAAEAIYLTVKTKISDNDVILTYGCSSLIYRMLVEAHKENIKFRVVIVDGRPWLEGREMLRRLLKLKIKCTYIFVTGLSFIMPEVTKVLLGTHALLANGYVMSRVGSSQVALMAKAHNVPVLVCCETYKFCERVQTDSFVYNEIGDPDDLCKLSYGSTILNKWHNLPNVTPLNLTYDVTPPDLVSAVVTELGILPCTSVPVILRIKPTEISY